MDSRHELLQQLKRMAQDKGITQVEIASAVGLKPSNISRMLEGKHSCSVDLLIKVAAAIGAKVALVDTQPEELSEKNVALLLNGLKTTGSMEEGYDMFVENFFIDEAADLRKFCQWVDKEVGGCGSANIQGLWHSFKHPDDPDSQYFVKITKARIDSFK